MKKVIKAIAFPVLALLMGIFWTGNIENVQAAEGTVYEIDSADKLAELAEMGGDAQTYEGYTLKLTDNIDMKDLSDEYEDEVIQFGWGDDGFKGTFDGQGHTIRNLNNVKSTLPDIDLGLFAETDGATIKNLTLEDSVVNCAYRGGILVGRAENTTIENVRIHGGKLKIQPGNNIVSLITNGGFFGGAIAGVVDHSTLYNCEVRGTEVVNNSTQGIAALEGEGLYMGGLVGSATASVIEYCRVDDGLQPDEEGKPRMVETKVRNEYDIAVGALGGKAVYAGGIAGEIKDGSKIIDSYSTADVYVYCATYVGVGAGNVAYAGGVVAEMYGGSCEVTRCHYAGNIHTEQYNALLVIPIIEKDKYMSGVAQYSENDDHFGVTNSYFQRSASETSKTFYAVNDEEDTENYKSLTDAEYRDRTFWIGKDYDLYGNIERKTTLPTDTPSGEAISSSHVNKWVMDYTRGIPIHGNSVSAALDFPGAGSVTIDGTDLIENSLEGIEKGKNNCYVTTSNAYNFAVQGFDTYEAAKGIGITADTTQIDGHDDAYRLAGWYLKRGIAQDSVSQIKSGYEELTETYANANKVSEAVEAGEVAGKYVYTAGGEGNNTGLEDKDLYIAHYQANVVFHDVNGGVINKATGVTEGEIDLSDDYYNYQQVMQSAEPTTLPGSDGTGYQFYGWTDVPNKENNNRGYPGITTDKLNELKSGGHIYQSGDLVEKPLKLYPIYTNYLSNIVTIMEGNERDDEESIHLRSHVATTGIEEEDGNIYLNIKGLDAGETSDGHGNEMESGIFQDGYRFLGWYEIVTDEDGTEHEYRISTEPRYQLQGVEFTSKHTYKARMEYEVEYWVRAFKSEIDPYYSESGAKYGVDEKGKGTFWQEYGSQFQNIAGPDLYLEQVAHWAVQNGNITYQENCDGCEYVCNDDMKIYDRLTVYSHNKQLSGVNSVVLRSDFPGAGTQTYKGLVSNIGFEVNATINSGYNFTLWTKEAYKSVIGQYDNQGTNTAENWTSGADMTGITTFWKCIYGAHYTANITFHQSNIDTADTETVTRRYHEPILMEEDATYTYKYEISGESTNVTNTSKASPGSGFTDKRDGYYFIGWIDKSRLSEYEINYIYDMEDPDCTSRLSKALPYIIDENDLVERPMDLYPVYVKSQIETTTNIKEAGVPAGYGINIPTDPTSELTHNAAENTFTLKLTADTDTNVVDDQETIYEFLYMECIANPGTPEETVTRLTPDTKGGNVFTLNNFDLGPNYKFIAYYNPLVVVYHVDEPKHDNANVEVVIRNYNEQLGDGPEPKFDTNAMGIGNETYVFKGWTASKPDDGKYYHLSDGQDVTLVNPTDAVTSSMELYPVYVKASISVNSNIDGDHTDPDDFRGLRQNTLTGNYEIFAEEEVVVGKGTRYVFDHWEKDSKRLSENPVVGVSDLFENTTYTAIYKAAHTVNYYYWNEQANKYEILYSAGVTDGSLVEKTTTGTGEEVNVPVHMEAFTGISNQLQAGQYFDQWQWLNNGTLTNWDNFANHDVTQDMNLYPVIWQVGVKDGDNNEMSQVAVGDTPPEVYIQADLTAKDAEGNPIDNPEVSVYFDGVYSQDKLTVSVGKQSYQTSGTNNGEFVGVNDIPVSVYNQYRLEAGEADPDHPDEIPEPVMTGDFMAKENTGNTDVVGDAVFTFAGKLEITKKLDSDVDTGESFIFKVTKLYASGNEESTTDVIVNAGETVTMSLPYGTYKVTEDDGWAWRYTPKYETETKNPDGDVSGQNTGVDAGGLGSDTIYINSFESSVICTNTESNSKWFDSSSNAQNVFGKEQAGQDAENNE